MEGEVIATQASGTIDFAYSRLVLQHVPTAFAVGYVSELIRVLADGGIAMFSAPHADPRSNLAGLRQLLRAVRELVPGQERMSLYPLSRSVVESAVTNAGGVMLAVLPDPHPPGWSGFLYIATRRAQGSTQR
jgi:hypothetical protein